MLEVKIALPFAWQPESANAKAQAAARQAQWQEAILILRVLQAMDSPGGREPDLPQNRGLERLEAKLDLAIHLLARDRNPLAHMPASIPLTLHAGGLRCDPRLPASADDKGDCRLYPSPALPLPLLLPAMVTEASTAGLTIAWLEMPEEVSELWNQWLFRQHRRLIQAQREHA